MGKRSNFDRVERDYYPTPMSAVTPLIPHLEGRIFLEPCAGDGRLVQHLRSFGLFCFMATDIEPMSEGVSKCDMFNLRNGNIFTRIDMVITNPPWDRKILHPMIEHFRELHDCVWLLFDADWVHTKQSAEYIKYCDKIISVGRVKWIEGSKTTGKDNCAWYRFRSKPVEKTVFVGR